MANLPIMIVNLLVNIRIKIIKLPVKIVKLPIKILGPCTTKVRAGSVFSAQSQARSQWELDSAKVVPCQQFCL